MKILMLELLSIILIILGLSVLIIIHEAGHFFAAKGFGLLVEEFGFGLPPRFWGKKIGETIYSFNWLPFGGFVKLYGERNMEEDLNLDISRSFSHQSIWKRAAVIGAGVVMNFLLGWFLISIIYMIGIPQTLLVTDIQKGGIADLAGIQAGDQLLDFRAVPELVNFLDANKGEEVGLSIQRGEEKIFVPVTPRTEVPEGEGNLGVFLVESGLPKQGLFQSIWEGLKTSIKTVGIIFVSLADLVVGIFTDISVIEKFVGPVGIVNVAIQTTKLGAVHFAQLVALISLNLAVFNIIPIPALDGGRLFFLLIEKLKGSPINHKAEIAINGIGFLILLILIVAITVKDILTLL